MSSYRNSCLVAAVLAVSAAAPAAAQQAYPMLMGLDPVAATVGCASEHTLRSRYSMDGASAVLVSGGGVSGEIVPAAGGEPPKLPQQAIQVRFTVAADALPGVRDVRIVTPRGASTLAQLVITPNPVSVESGDNNVAAAATAVTLPATLCGRFEKAGDVDHYRFTARAGQTLSFVARCNALQDRIHDLQNHADPILTLRSASGATLAMSDNLVGADPILRHRFEADGDYLLEVRDVRYAGNEHWLYAIEAGEWPVARAIFPLAVPPGPVEQPTRPIGPGFAADAAGTLVLPAGHAVGMAWARLRLEGQPDQAVRAVIHPGPFAMEASAGDAPADAQAVALPVGIQGVVERPGDIDLFAFEARKGERFSFEVTARRAGSPLDGHVRLLDAAGKPLQANDDLRDGNRTFADPRIENWTAPADGRYLLEIRDLNFRGGDDFVYFLEAAAATEDFRLFADTDKTPLAAGTGGVIFVRAERRHGFVGEIALAIEGLPAGVTAAAGRILAAPNVDGCILLSAPPDAKPSAANVTIRGSAAVRGADGQPAPVTRPATIYQEIYLPGGGRGHWPAEMHTVSVGTSGDIRRVTVAPMDLSLAPGGSATLDVTIDRAEGFDKNVLLEVHAMHLGGIFGDPLPKGVTVDAAASTTLLAGGATKGRIVLKAAADAKPVDRQQFGVIGNVSLNFVMKASYASDPIVVTVK
jgi:hypothetical protein